jgi:hypothetical protein
MSFGTKYRSEFYDNEGLDWKWDFEVEDYSGSITTMQAGGDPMSYEPLSSSDDLYESPVRGTKASLRVIATSLGQWDVFSTVANLEIRASIYQGGNLYFRGWVQPGEYKELYNDYPYEVEIVVTDGLAYLKEIDYVPSTEGRRSEDDILITDILSEIGFTGFNEIVNIYEANMASGTGDSPIQQTYPHTDAFEDMTCYEALEYILKKWKALIRQKDGIFWIYRPKEMTGTAYVRKFTAVGTKTSESVSYIQEICRSTSASDFRDTNGGTKMHHPPAKSILLSHDWGNNQSWIKNWELKAETFDGTDFEEWTRYNSIIINPLSESVKDEQSGIEIGGGTTANYIQTVFAPHAKYAPTDLLTLEFEYGVYNAGSSQIATVNTNIEVRHGSYYLDSSGGFLSWVPFQTMITIANSNVNPGFTGWTKWKQQMGSAGFLLDGLLTLSLFPGATGFGHAFFKNIRIFVSSYDLVAKKSSWVGGQRALNFFYPNVPQRITLEQELKEIKEKEYSISAAAYGEKYEEDHILGDVTPGDSGINNVLEQFKGSLGYSEVLDPHDFKMCFIRNEEMNNTLAIASSTMLAITDKTGQVITVDTLPDYEQFDVNGWVAMLIDEDKTNTVDPTATGDYLYKNFVTIDRSAKTLTFPVGYSLSAWEVGDNLALYNPFINYSFVGDQTQGPIISLSGAPAWRDTSALNGGMFRHSDGRFIWLFSGYDGSAYSIGYAYTDDFVTWTIGNSDAPVVVPGDFADCDTVHQPGSIHPVVGSPGDYFCLISPRRASDGKNEIRIMYFDEDFTTITFSDPITDTTPYYGKWGGSLVKIGSYYHLAYLYANQLPADREIRVAKCEDLEGPYVDYQTILAGTSGVNDGVPWSNNVDAFGIFFDGAKYYGLFGGTSKWSESGNKGNRLYCLLDFNEETEVWSFNEKSPVIINPLYYQDINSTYQWCGDHCGGYLAMFVEGTDVYLSLTMKGTVYQAALFKFNNIGNVFATSEWARRGVTEAKQLLQIIGEEIAEQKDTQRQMIAGYPVYDLADSDNAAHLNILGVFTDDLNEISEGVPRKFAFNQGRYKVKQRLWHLDLVEIKE